MVVPLLVQAFLYLVGHLRKFPLDRLQLLPLALRKNLLANLPPVDVHWLEQSSFTSDIDVDNVWKKLCTTRCKTPNRFSDYMRNVCSLVDHPFTWKSCFLTCCLFSDACERSSCSCKTHPIFSFKSESLAREYACTESPCGSHLCQHVMVCECGSFLPSRYIFQSQLPVTDMVQALRSIWELFAYQPSVVVVTDGVFDGDCSHLEQLAKDDPHLPTILSGVKAIKIKTEDLSSFSMIDKVNALFSQLLPTDSTSPCSLCSLEVDHELQATFSGKFHPRYKHSSSMCVIEHLPTFLAESGKQDVSYCNHLTNLSMSTADLDVQDVAAISRVVSSQPYLKRFSLATHSELFSQSSSKLSKEIATLFCLPCFQKLCLSDTRISSDAHLFFETLHSFTNSANPTSASVVLNNVSFSHVGAGKSKEEPSLSCRDSHLAGGGLKHLTLSCGSVTSLFSSIPHPVMKLDSFTVRGVSALNIFDVHRIHVTDMYIDCSLHLLDLNRFRSVIASSDDEIVNLHLNIALLVTRYSDMEAVSLIENFADALRSTRARICKLCVKLNGVKTRNENVVSSIFAYLSSLPSPVHLEIDLSQSYFRTEQYELLHHAWKTAGCCKMQKLTLQQGLAEKVSILQENYR